MRFLSDFKYKAYQVTYEGDIREWTLDSETMKFRALGREYSPDAMPDDALLVRVSNITDDKDHYIEEGQRIMDIYGDEYEVQVCGISGCFIAVNDKGMFKHLNTVTNPSIIRKYPLTIVEELQEVKRNIEPDEIYDGTYDFKFKIDTHGLEEYAKKLNMSVTPLRKKQLKIIDWEIDIAFGPFDDEEEENGNKVRGVYRSGVYTVKDIELTKVTHDRVIEMYENITEYGSYIKSMEIVKKHHKAIQSTYEIKENK